MDKNGKSILSAILGISSSMMIPDIGGGYSNRRSNSNLPSCKLTAGKANKNKKNKRKSSSSSKRKNRK